MIKPFIVPLDCAIGLTGPFTFAHGARAADDAKAAAPGHPATEPAAAPKRRGGRPNRPIVLGPDDEQLFPDPPAALAGRHGRIWPGQRWRL